MAASSTPSVYPSHGTLYAVHSPQATAAAALSEHLAPLQEGGNANKKRKTTNAPGSRGVANLTPEQLAKKRANDREAQRAIRERTRNTIQNLEQRIRELESQQPFQELQRALTERDNALRECEELRRKLAGVAQLVGTAATGGTANGLQHVGQSVPASLNGTFLIDDYIDPVWLNPDGAELAALTAQQAPLPSHAVAAQSPAQQYAGYGHDVHPDLRSPSFGPTHGSPASHTSHQDQVRRNWSPNTTVPSNGNANSQYNNASGTSYENQQPPAAAMVQQSSNGDRLGLNYIMDKSSPQHSSSIYAKLPKNTSPASPLDSLLSDFIATRRSLLKAGKSKLEALGPEYPSFAALHDPSKKSSSHPVSNLLIDILSKFPDISALPEKVAVLYIMFLVLRWFICPCQECYDRMPEWIRPVGEQLERPHPHWVDHLPWSVDVVEGLYFDLFCVSTASEMESNEVVNYLTDNFFRPYMRKQMSAVCQKRFDDFFVPFTTTLCLNWPHPEESVLAQGGANSGMVSEGFERHLRDLRNWSLGASFKQTFPDLVNEQTRIALSEA